MLLQMIEHLSFDGILTLAYHWYLQYAAKDIEGI